MFTWNGRVEPRPRKVQDRSWLSTFEGLLYWFRNCVDFLVADAYPGDFSAENRSSRQTLNLNYQRIIVI